MILSMAEIQGLIQEINDPVNKRRKKAEYDLFQGYAGGLKPYVRDRVIQMFPKTGNVYTISDYSVTKKVVNKKSKSYKEPPIRKLPTAKETELYNKIANDYDLNCAMRELDKNYNRHRYALMAVFMASSFDEMSREAVEFKFVPLAPHQFDLKLNDEGEPVVVILSYTPAEVAAGALGYVGIDSSIAGYESNEGSEKYGYYVIWTDEQHLVVRYTKSNEKLPGNVKEAGKIELLSMPLNPNNENPWGVLPFAYCPVTGDSNYPITNPIGEQSIEMNALMSIYLTSGSMQIGQLVTSYPADQEMPALAHGLFSTLNLPQSSDPDAKPTTTQWIAPSPNMDGHRKSIMTFLALILDEQGLGVTGQLDGETDFKSALDRMVANADVQDAIEENQQVYGELECEIFEIIRAQLDSVGMNPFSYDSDLQIVYRKPKMLISDTEKLQNIKMMKELGMIEDWQMLQMFDPNLSEDEAKAQMERINAAKKPEPALPQPNNQPMNGVKDAAGTGPDNQSN